MCLWYFCVSAPSCNTWFCGVLTNVHDAWGNDCPQTKSARTWTNMTKAACQSWRKVAMFTQKQPHTVYYTKKLFTFSGEKKHLALCLQPSSRKEIQWDLACCWKILFFWWTEEYLEWRKTMRLKVKPKAWMMQMLLLVTSHRADKEKGAERGCKGWIFFVCWPCSKCTQQKIHKENWNWVITYDLITTTLSKRWLKVARVSIKFKTKSPGIMTGRA